jgi:hypothetical protein
MAPEVVILARCSTHPFGPCTERTNQRLPSGPLVMPKAASPGRVGESVTTPPGVMRPMSPEDGNQRLPSGPAVMEPIWADSPHRRPGSGSS